MTVLRAESDADVMRCYPVMAELRPHVTRDEFLGRVRRQAATGYRLAFVPAAAGGGAAAVAGYRVFECLAWGRLLYVDDLVTASAVRSRGLGQGLFDFLIGEARSEGCDQLHLDSGVQRFAAHRFYLRNRMSICSHHFSLKLGE